MVSEQHQTGLLISVPVYFVILAGCAYWAHRRMERMEHDKVVDKLSAHYLGGREFGPLMTAGTIFASLFSGYTVIGVPNEAYKTGWAALRWMATIWTIVFGYFGTGLRLRKASNIRNHQSPVDFITDRFQSQFLRYTIVFLQVVPAVIYLAAQVAAIKGTFNAMFNLPPDSAVAVVIIMALILIFEWVGGLSSVALTDCVQAVVMLFSFIALPCVISSKFYRWRDLDPYDYPRPDFYQTPSRETQWDFWQFTFINFSFFTLPHLMQRTYAAADLSSLKTGYAVMAIANWFTMLTGVFIGTVGVMMLNGETVASPFTSILEALMDEGGFAKAIGVIAATASLAAIMSTADSLVIAISQLVTVEIVYPLRPSTTPKEIAWIGRAVSLIGATLALLIGIFWKEGIADMGAIQFPLSMQAVPAFIIGLYGWSDATDIHPWSVAAAAVASTIYVLAIYFSYMKSTGEPMPINAGITGFALQIGFIVFVETTRRLVGLSKRSRTQVSECSEEDKEEVSAPTVHFPNRPQWDVPKLSRFGQSPLSPQLVWKAMDGVNEPLANPWWAFLMFFAISMLAPTAPEHQPPLDPNTGSFYSSAPPPTVNGIPWWALKIILLSIVPFVMLMIVTKNMPNEFTVDAEKIEKEGIDPDLIELTLCEKGRRTSYDERNVLVHRRRSTISKVMDEVKMAAEKARNEEDSHIIESRRRMSNLVMAKNLSLEHGDLEEILEETI